MAVLLDDFIDLVASKVVALVERGAPRDFRDIYIREDPSLDDVYSAVGRVVKGNAYAIHSS